MKNMWIAWVGTIHSPSPLASPDRFNSPSFRVRLVSARSTASPSTVPLVRLTTRNRFILSILAEHTCPGAFCQCSIGLTPMAGGCCGAARIFSPVGLFLHSTEPRPLSERLVRPARKPLP